jgi:hypothetical protein
VLRDFLHASAQSAHAAQAWRKLQPCRPGTGVRQQVQPLDRMSFSPGIDRANGHVSAGFRLALAVAVIRLSFSSPRSPASAMVSRRSILRGHRHDRLRAVQAVVLRLTRLRIERTELEIALIGTDRERGIGRTLGTNSTVVHRN